MSNFKNKYEENLKSADLLVQKEYYSASVHCYYYACVQLMLYVLKNIAKIDEQTFFNEQKNSESGFHIWVINKTRDLMLNKNFEAAREFYNWITQLKRTRVEADYKETIIDKQKILVVKKYTDYVFETIKFNFEV